MNTVVHYFAPFRPPLVRLPFKLQRYQISSALPRVTHAAAQALHARVVKVGSCTRMSVSLASRPRTCYPGGRTHIEGTRGCTSPPWAVLSVRVR
jgi:hypothetical protein